jgi:hypothetical protein
MAEIVLAVGYSHTPYLFADASLWPRVRQQIRKGKPVRDDLPRESDEELRDKYRRARAAFDQLRESIARSQADVIIVLGDDQKEIFSSIVTGFTIFSGKRMEGKKLPSRVREVTGNEEWLGIANQQTLAREILQGLHEQNFDVAFFDVPENREDGFGHAFVPPLAYLTPGCDRPVIPILVNCYYPPQPTARRCYDFGQALARVIKGVTTVQCVAIAASGGLWHTPGQADATIDVEFDRHFLSLLTERRAAEVAGLPAAALVSGTGEIRNWIVAAGATGAKRWEVLDYIPLYYSPIGLGFARCSMNEI